MTIKDLTLEDILVAPEYVHLWNPLVEFGGAFGYAGNRTDIYGNPNFVQNDKWVGGEALDTSGGDYGTTLPQDLTFQLMNDVRWTIAFTTQLGSGDYGSGSNNRFFETWENNLVDGKPGITDNDTAYWMIATDRNNAGPGEILFNSESLNVSSNATVDDNTPHRVVIEDTFDGPMAASNIDIYVDATETTGDRSGSADHTHRIATGSGFGGRKGGLSGFDNGIDAIIDNYVMYLDYNLSASEIQTDYDNQPWS